MKEWIRKTFGKLTPNYGKCGGAKRDCAFDPNELDWMDKAFMTHDNDLKGSEVIRDKKTRQEARNKADKKLAKALREGNPKELTLWGRTYRRMAMLVFKV